MKISDLEQKCPKRDKKKLAGDFCSKSVLEVNSEWESTCRQLEDFRSKKKFLL